MAALTPPPSLHRLLLVGVVVLAALLTACGEADPAGEVSSGSPAQGEGSVALPTLPATAERRPGLYDEAGCSRTSEGSDCSSRSADLDAALAGTAESDWRVLAGFSGSRWTTDLPGGVGVLPDTITTGATADGVWVGRGLVRNHNTNEVAGVEVHAALLDGSGQVLATVAAPVVVPSIRPGEPVAFELTATDVEVEVVPSPSASTPGTVTTTSPVDNASTLAPTSPAPDATTAPATTAPPATTPPTTDSTTTAPRATGPTTTAAQMTRSVAAVEVAEVRWSVYVTGTATAPIGRDLELATLWQRGLADPRPVDLYLFSDPVTGPRPLVVFGGATSVGSAPIEQVAVLGAWIDERGRVLDVAEAIVARPEGVDPDGPLPPAALESGETADLVLSVDADGAPIGIDNARLMLWGWGS